MNILVPPIMLTIKPRIVTKFWSHSSISCIQLMSFWCPFLVPHLTTHHSTIGVRLGPLTLYHKDYKCKIQGFAVCLWQIVLPKKSTFLGLQLFFLNPSWTECTTTKHMPTFNNMKRNSGENMHLPQSISSSTFLLHLEPHQTYRIDHQKSSKVDNLNCLHEYHMSNNLLVRTRNHPSCQQYSISSNPLSYSHWGSQLMENSLMLAEAKFTWDPI